MRYGTREICNVVLKDVVTKEPVVYLESLTTSSLESKATTVYARGGRGNPKLIGWDSEKEISMKMEDALISKASLGLLVGDSFKESSRPVHKKEVLRVVDNAGSKEVKLSHKVTSEADYPVFIYKTEDGISMEGGKLTASFTEDGGVTVATLSGADAPAAGEQVIVDYYYNAANKKSLSISSDKFAGTYLLEGETLWRNEEGQDVPALFTIPKLKILNEFTIEMAATGDPKPFNFSAEVLKDTKSTSMVVIDLLEE
ncbi:hypothetical protein [Paenibacillus sp. y28]|uniref:hypothetical protein n=1 Tax=Paenibacillus sp. y28 TaxID=3129110 RepID=UPI003016D81F